MTPIGFQATSLALSLWNDDLTRGGNRLCSSSSFCLSLPWLGWLLTVVMYVITLNRGNSRIAALLPSYSRQGALLGSSVLLWLCLQEIESD